MIVLSNPPDVALLNKMYLFVSRTKSSSTVQNEYIIQIRCTVEGDLLI